MFAKSRRRRIFHLNGTVKGWTSKSIGVFGIESHLHNIMVMAIENLSAYPTLLPVPQSYSHIITGSQHVGLSGVNGNRTNIVRVCFEGCNLFGGVVVVDTELEVIWTADNPVLPRDESTGTDRDIGKLECFDDGLWWPDFSYASVSVAEETYLWFVGPNVDVTCSAELAHLLCRSSLGVCLPVHTAVKGSQNPWLRRMEVCHAKID